MLHRLAIAPLLLTSALAWSSDAPTTLAGPWTESFTMTIKDTERVFVVHSGSSYLVTKPEDFADADFVSEKDVMVTSKFERGQGERIALYNLPEVEVKAAADLWSTRVDGDNVYIFGHMTTDTETGKPVLRVSAIEPAPSDGQLIAKRMANIQKTDWERRIAVVAWAREQAATQGNKEYWLQETDHLLTSVITDAAAEAEAKQDFALAQRAMDWCVDIQRDPIRAGRIGSMPWIRAKGGEGAEQVSKRMHRLGLEFYRDQWRARSEALAMEYDDRTSAISWKDADGFYKLGRWADANAEYLPQAKDRSYRAYQAGFRANPDHPGIRRELALDINAGETTVESGQIRLDYKDSTTSVIVKAPLGWRRSDAISGDVTWIDPKSETSYVSARFIQLNDTTDLNGLWNSISTPLRARSGFSEIATQAGESKSGETRTLRYSFTEGRYKRVGEVRLIVNRAAKAAVAIEASSTEEELDAVSKVGADMLTNLVFPAASDPSGSGGDKSHAQPKKRSSDEAATGKGSGTPGTGTNKPAQPDK
ncbi:MAG: hypothetical protein H0V44_04645 [Planctomycetes bacterium]|nr:hypothetical protein [Planctomycetota bacterium]